MVSQRKFTKVSTQVYYELAEKDDVSIFNSSILEHEQSFQVEIFRRKETYEKFQH